VVCGIRDAREIGISVGISVGMNAGISVGISAGISVGISISAGMLALSRAKVHVPGVKPVRVNEKTHVLLIFELQCV
jgi:hypothetical protein